MRPHRTAGIVMLTLVLLLALAPAGPPRAQEVRPVGTVAALVGQASVLRFGEQAPAPLAPGAALIEGDRLRTGPDGRVRIELADGSTLQLGQSTELTLSWVLHAPALETTNVVLDLSTGILRAIVETLLPHAAFEIQSATAITSVRGTDLILEAAPETTAVVALEGSVLVRSAAPEIPDAVTLEAGEGTDVAAGAPPAPPVRWGEARRDDFVARTDVPAR